MKTPATPALPVCLFMAVLFALSVANVALMLWLLPWVGRRPI